MFQSCVFKRVLLHYNNIEKHFASCCFHFRFSHVGVGSTRTVQLLFQAQDCLLSQALAQETKRKLNQNESRKRIENGANEVL